MSANIKVAIRPRPLVESLKEKWAPGLEIRGSRITMGMKIFDPDVVFDSGIGQCEVYEHCVPIIESVKDGRNGTIMVYGQTGTGKTHTMLGGPNDNSGIAFSAISALLEHVQSKTLDGCQIALSLSMIEIYNERMTDMLAAPPPPPGGSSSTLTHGDEPTSEVCLINGFPHRTTKVTLCEVSDAARTVRKALSSRHVSPTAINDRSSRSHVIVILSVEERSAIGDGSFEVANLYLVDLAGSECVKKSLATGKAAAEAGMINKSLLALRSVVMALTSTSPNSQPTRVHVPYRDSKLTELLQDSIGGTARTMIIACISPIGRDIEETKSTLEYACKAKKVRNNYSSDEKEKYRARIRSLELQLQAQINRNGGMFMVTKDELTEFTAQQSEIESLNEKIEVLRGEVKNMSAEQSVNEYVKMELHRVMEQSKKEREQQSLAVTTMLRRAEEIFVNAKRRELEFTETIRGVFQTEMMSKEKRRQHLAEMLVTCGGSAAKAGGSQPQEKQQHDGMMTSEGLCGRIEALVEEINNSHDSMIAEAISFVERCMERTDKRCHDATSYQEARFQSLRATLDEIETDFRRHTRDAWEGMSEDLMSQRDSLVRLAQYPPLCDKQRLHNVVVDTFHDVSRTFSVRESEGDEELLAAVDCASVTFQRSVQSTVDQMTRAMCAPPMPPVELPQQASDRCASALASPSCQLAQAVPRSSGPPLRARHSNTPQATPKRPRSDGVEDVVGPRRPPLSSTRIV